MKKWQINCDGWYPYCPVCNYESFYRTPICLHCGAILEPNNEDMESMRAKDPETYNYIMQKYEDKIREKST